MYGNELTTAITCWTVGYVVGQSQSSPPSSTSLRLLTSTPAPLSSVPSNLLLTRISPRWWIPFLELGWGICTLASYKVQNSTGLYTVRFFVGLFESGFYPAAQYIRTSACFVAPAALTPGSSAQSAPSTSPRNSASALYCSTRRVD